MRCCIEAILASVATASRLMLMHAVWSALQAGAPTIAAIGMMMSALATSGLRIFSSRQSPRTTSKLGSAQSWLSGVCLYMKLSSTVTL